MSHLLAALPTVHNAYQASFNVMFNYYWNSVQHLESTHPTETSPELQTHDCDVTIEDEHLLDSTDDPESNPRLLDNIHTRDVDNQAQDISIPAHTSQHQQPQGVQDQSEGDPPPLVHTSQSQDAQDVHSQTHVQTNTSYKNSPNLPLHPPLPYNLPPLNSTTNRLPLPSTPPHLFRPQNPYSPLYFVPPAAPTPQGTRHYDRFTPYTTPRTHWNNQRGNSWCTRHSPNSTIVLVKFALIFIVMPSLKSNTNQTYHAISSI